MKKYILFIGSDNATGILAVDLILSIVKNYFDNFTYSLVKGFYNSKQENTMKLEIWTSEPSQKVESLCRELKTELKQESIMLEKNSIVDFI